MVEVIDVSNSGYLDINTEYGLKEGLSLRIVQVSPEVYQLYFLSAQSEKVAPPKEVQVLDLHEGSDLQPVSNAYFIGRKSRYCVRLDNVPHFLIVCTSQD